MDYVSQEMNYKLPLKNTPSRESTAMRSCGKAVDEATPEPLRRLL
jgi:hypothetical protein